MLREKLMTVSEQTYEELVANLPAAATLILHNVSWEEYEELLDVVGEASGLRISFSEGMLQVMTLSREHEIYERVIQFMVNLCTMRLGIKVCSLGSATLRKRKKKKGLEADCCFWIGRSDLPVLSQDLDFERDPPPDLAVEVDIHHESLSKFPIYAALGIPEVWRHDGETLIIYHLQNAEYHVAPASLALPVLASEPLTAFLRRLKEEDENSVLLAFEDWLRKR